MQDLYRLARRENAYRIAEGDLIVELAFSSGRNLTDMTKIYSTHLKPKYDRLVRAGVDPVDIVPLYMQTYIGVNEKLEMRL